jgi:hypothetical protein
MRGLLAYTRESYDRFERRQTSGYELDIEKKYFA